MGRWVHVYLVPGAVLVSGLIALTLSPVMSSRVLKKHGEQGRFADWLDERFGVLKGPAGKFFLVPRKKLPFRPSPAFCFTGFEGWLR